MVEVKNNQIVITLNTTEPEEDLATIRYELLECIAGYGVANEINNIHSVYRLMRGLLPTIEQEKKANKQPINTL